MLVLLVAPASAQPTSAVPAKRSTDLSGNYITLGPLGSATRVEGSWDGAFGGELSYARIDEGRRLVGLGLSVGGIQYTERSGGRVWLDAFVGWRSVLGLAIGLSGGGTVELDELRLPRWGGQVTWWAYAGVMPYIRLGTVQRGGAFVDAGLKIPLPALRW